MDISRRLFLAGSATALAAPYVSKAFGQETINVASIVDLSGGLEIYGQPMDACLDLAVSEINEKGGLLGRQIAVKKYDPQSSIQLYTQYATEAATSQKASVVFGGITSASREAIRPILSRYETLYFYPPLYEGGVCDRNFFSTGSTPGQTISKLMPYAVENLGKKVYILAADYNYGTISAKWVKKYTAEAGGSVIGEEYFPLDVTQFGATIQKIQDAKPDVIFTLLVGGNHISFYRQWAAAGMTGKIPIVSSEFGGGNEHIILTPEESNGIISVFGYFQELDNPVNKQFLAQLKAKSGDKVPYVTEHAQATYNAVHHWANGVAMAGGVDRMKVIEAIESGSSFESPGGLSTMDAATHHCWIRPHIAVVQDKGFKILESFERQAPSDTAAVCDLNKNPDDTKQYEIE